MRTFLSGSYNPISFRHVRTLTDSRGILEHAQGTVPRYSHGYCTDDNARLLIVAARDGLQTTETEELAYTAMKFLLEAQNTDGTMRNRMSVSHEWTDEPAVDDCWGRAMWAFGTAASHRSTDMWHKRALEAFELSAQQHSPWLRSNCFAALGAAEILKVLPNNAAARRVLKEAVEMIPLHTSIRLDPSIIYSGWMWPEQTLRYANAILPETLIASGQYLDNDDHLERGLQLLDWLVSTETKCGHLSVTPTSGRKYKQSSPIFDQQPIEVAAIADASWRAAAATKDAHWLKSYAKCVNWFHGDNDNAMPMIDYESHGGYDGLTTEGVNLNQGAESTLAMLATLQERTLL
jgi:hypothetical protein